MPPLAPDSTTPPAASGQARWARWAGVLAAMLISAASFAPPPAAAAAPVRSGGSDAIDSWVEERMAASSIPGAAVAVVRRGEVVHLAGYGSADEDGRAVGPDTPFILGSTSKPFTAVVVGQLVDEGLLAWDEPVWPYLSGLVDEAPEGFERATVEQLLTHTGGLGMAVGTAGTVRIHEGPEALHRRVEELLSHPLARPPGEAWEYSNAGPMLLAAVVEQVTGETFADALRDRVFEPLGMTGSFATAEEARTADMATGHRQWFGRWRPADLPYDEAGVAMGYVASTAHDLARFMRAHLDGDPAVPASAAEIASGPVVPTGWPTTLDAGYGRGWFVDELAGTPVISHPGSLGHFTAQVLLAPDADLGVAVVTNASGFLSGGSDAHEAQYDLGLGLIHLLLGEEPHPAGHSVLVTVVAPVVAWALLALMVGGCARSLLGLRRHGLPRAAGVGARRWVRSLLPAVVPLLVGVGLLAAPLGMARHFHPDVGWAATAIAYLALLWGLVRLLLAFVAQRAAGVDAADDRPDAAGARRTPVAAR